MDKKINFLLMAILTIIPFNLEKQFMGYVWITVTDVLTAISAVLAGTNILRNRHRFFGQNKPLLFLWSGLLFFFFLSFIKAENYLLWGKEFMKFTFLTVLFYLIFEYLDIQFVFNLFPVLCFIGASAVSLWFFVDLFYGKVDISQRVWFRFFGPYTQLNTLGMYFLAALPFGLFLLLEKRRYRFFILMGIIFELTVLLLTYSRGNWLAFIFLLILVMVFLLRWKGVAICLFAIGIVIFLAQYFTSVDSIKERFLSSFSIRESAVLSRKYHLETAWMLFKKFPLTGTGLGNFQIAARRYHYRYLFEMAHNMFLQYAAEAGIFAVLFLLGICIKYYYDAITLLKKVTGDTRLFLLCSIFSFSGLFLSSQFSDPFVHSIKEYFIFLLAVPYIIRKSQSDQTKNIS